MGTNDETVSDIVNEMREDDVRIGARETPKTEKMALSYACSWCKGYADRIEAAHRREVDKLNFDLMTIKSEQKTSANVIIEQTNKCEALKREVAELRRRLKVAEDALTKLQDRFVSSVHDGTIDPYEALKIAEDALAAIREEGGAK